MAISFDAATTDNTLEANPSWSHTCGAGSDRYLLVGVYTADAAVVTGVTYNGVAMTQVGIPQTPLPGSGYNLYLFRLANPASGANTVQVSTSSGTASGVSVSYAGVTGGVVNVAQGIEGAGSPVNYGPITTSVTNAWIAGALNGDFATVPAAGTGTTVRNSSAGARTFADSNGTVTPGSNNLQLTYTGGFGGASYIIVELSPTAAPSGPTNLKTLDTNVKANIKTYNTNPIANVKTIDTNA